MNKKRKKSSRMRGTHTCGRGFKKKARGSGHRGGFGMAGTGKRGDQKKSLILNYAETYFGKKGNKPKPKYYKIINLSNLNEIATEKEVTLKDYKLLGNGEIKKPVIVKVKYASKSAISKIEKAGGKVILSKD
jgi:large subunit ribosomal protein L15